LTEDHRKSARQIAALCNAAPDNEAIWVVGFDDQTRTFHPPGIELANWWPQVTRYFDGPAPSTSNYVTSIEGHPVTLMHFACDARPFVSLREDGNAEVPWRTQSLTRNAKRTELLKLLVPQVALPSFEVVMASVAVEKRGGPTLTIRVHIYVVPPTQDVFTIPKHKCSLKMDVGEFIAGINNATWGLLDGDSSVHQLQLTGPQGISIQSRGQFQDWSVLTRRRPKLQLTVGIAGNDVAAVIEAQPELKRDDAEAIVFYSKHEGWGYD
jgi:hypothetical protein